MSGCSHPISAQYHDRQRGATYCTICGDCVQDEQFEIDPIFERGAAGGARGGNQLSRGTAAGSLRSLGGSLRPTRSADGALLPAHASRQTIDAARREMLNIARKLEINDDTVNIALSIYTTALRNHIVSGTRSVVLCACLYAACRRERTTHIIYDFVEATQDSAHGILTHMKLICEGTKTEVPIIDPSRLVQRLAEQMDLGERTSDVVVCALKVLRAMRDDWIACGRRPMGVCAAALLVGCYVFNIQRTPEQVCGMARLTAETVARRLTEFSATPAAELDSIDDYRPSNTTMPPAFNDSSRKSTEEDMGAEMRELSALYYELVADAKVSTPATEERCRKWRYFIQKHCETENQTPIEANLDLTRLTPLDQLRILGLAHTTPIPYDVAEQSVKREEEKVTIKLEEESQRTRLRRGGGHEGSLAGDSLAQGLYSQPASTQFGTAYGSSNHHNSNHSGGLGGALSASASSSYAPLGGGGGGSGGSPHVDYNDPQQLNALTDRYRNLLEENPEVRGLHEQFDLVDEDAVEDDFGFGPSTLSNAHTGGSGFLGDREGGSDTGADVAFSPSPVDPWGVLGDAAASDELGLAGERQALLDRDQSKAALEEILRDKDRRHALPWEFLVLQTAEQDSTDDLLQYLVLDNEERIRREKVGQAMYKTEWDRGRPRTQEEILQLEENRQSKKRRRQVIMEPTTVPDALERALQGRGAGTVNISHLDAIIPGLLDGEDDDGQDEWED